METTAFRGSLFHHSIQANMLGIGLHSQSSPEAGWAFWWCTAIATRKKVEEVHHQVAHSNEQLYLDVVGTFFLYKDGGSMRNCCLVIWRGSDFHRARGWVVFPFFFSNYLESRQSSKSLVRMEVTWTHTLWNGISNAGKWRFIGIIT